MTEKGLKVQRQDLEEETHEMLELLIRLLAWSRKTHGNRTMESIVKKSEKVLKNIKVD